MITGTTGNWTGWPECPQCHARREARCNACLARGTEFRLADTGESEGVDDDAEVLLLCSTCDEPFAPQFYRCCAECGFDFGEGIEQSEIVREELNNRVVLVMVGVALLLIGLLGFFAIVLRG